MKEPFRNKMGLVNEFSDLLFDVPLMAGNISSFSRPTTQTFLQFYFPRLSQQGSDCCGMNKSMKGEI